MKKLNIFSLGIAIFTMFFGAGNIVFPLVLGREVGETIPFALIGFILTAVAVPILGVIACSLFEGDYAKFFASAGKIPAVLLLGICMVVNGLCIPRCVILSYSAIQDYIPFCSLFFYSIIAAVFIFSVTVKENRVVDILGKVLGPVKITMLLAIVVLGLLTIYALAPSALTPAHSFLIGLKKGYYTCDLTCGIFFAYLIYSAIQSHSEGNVSVKRLISKGLQASFIGGGLLALVYIGFGFVASIHGQFLMDVAPDKLLSAIAVTILGSKAGILANATIAVACLTTAIALTTIVADYVTYELFKNKFPYLYCLIGLLLAIIGMSNLGFVGIMKWIDPVVSLSYPTLIVLALSNIFNKLFGFKYTKIAVLVTFVLTLLLQYRIVL